MSQDPTASQLQEHYRALQDLVNSKGWKVLHQYLQEDMMHAATLLAQPKPMETEDLHFRRGAMWAGQRLLNAPNDLIQRIESSPAILNLNKTTQPAKAGKDKT